MKMIVLDPGGEEIEPGELAGAGVRDGSGEPRGGDRDERAETRGPALAEDGQGARSIVVQVAPLRRPALRVDRREARAAVEDHADSRAEVLDLFVAQVADDLDRRPLGRRRARTPGGRVEVLEQRVEHRGKPRQLEPGAGQHVARIVHGADDTIPGTWDAWTDA